MTGRAGVLLRMEKKGNRYSADNNDAPETRKSFTSRLKSNIIVPIIVHIMVHQICAL